MNEKHKLQTNRAALRKRKRTAAQSDILGSSADASEQTRRDAAAYDARVANRPRLQRPPRVPFVEERGRSIGAIEAAQERKRGILV